MPNERGEDRRIPCLRSALRGVQENVNGAMANLSDPDAALRWINMAQESLREARTVVEIEMDRGGDE